MTRKENILRTINRDSPEWIPYRYDGSLTLIRPNIVVRPVEGGRDDWGVYWVPTNEIEGSCPDGQPVISLEEIDSYQVPATDWDRVTKNLKHQIESLSQTDTLVIAYNELTLFERAQLLLGNAEFLMATALEPQQLEMLLDKILDYQEMLTQAIMKSGISGVRFTDDWGMQSTLFISPEKWRKLIKPRLSRLYRVVKQRGGIVFQHSCGHIEEIVPDLIEIGIEVLDPCQPEANDIFKWKHDYGDQLTFMGGLDTQRYLSFGTPKEVKENVKKVLSIMGKGGGYIAAPSHTITISEENRKAMVEVIDEIRKCLYQT